MQELKVYIEINGQQMFVGSIRGNSYEDACFMYAKEYLSGKAATPISVSLSLQKEPFYDAFLLNTGEKFLDESLRL